METNLALLADHLRAVSHCEYASRPHPSKIVTLVAWYVAMLHALLAVRLRTPSQSRVSIAGEERRANLPRSFESQARSQQETPPLRDRKISHEHKSVVVTGHDAPHIVVRARAKESREGNFTKGSDEMSALSHGGIETPVLPHLDRKSTRLNSSHSGESRMPSSA